MGIRDVAAAARVSTATVSRALRGLPRVSLATRRKVEAAASDLGYVASAAASELARTRNALAPLPSLLNRIVLIVPSVPHRTQQVTTGPDVDRVVRPVAAAHGFLVTVMACPAPGMADAVRSVSGAAAGIAVNPAMPTSALREALADSPVPTAEVHEGPIPYAHMPDRPSPGLSDGTVVISGAGLLGYRLAVDYLIQASRTRA